MPKNNMTAVVFEVHDRGEVIGRVTLENADRHELVDVLRQLCAVLENTTTLKGAELRGALKVLEGAPRTRKRPSSKPS